jgi:hypothetical protein
MLKSQTAPGNPEQVSPGTPSGGGAKEEKKEQKLGLVKFLQLFPQSGGLTALLRIKHGSEAKTQSEWTAAVAALLATKAK